MSDEYAASFFICATSYLRAVKDFNESDTSGNPLCSKTYVYIFSSVIMELITFSLIFGRFET